MRPRGNSCDRTSNRTSPALAVDLLERSHLVGLGEAELDSVSDRVPPVTERVESLVQLAAQLGHLRRPQVDVHPRAWREGRLGAV